MESGSVNHPPAWSRSLRRVVRPFLNTDEKNHLRTVVAEAQRRTCARIEVQVIPRAGRRSILDMAEERTVVNGVLILVSHLDHQFAIWGDAALHAKAGQAFWDNLSESLRNDFSERRYAEGLERCVIRLGNQLSTLAPI